MTTINETDRSSETESTDEVEYLGGFRYLIRSATPSDLTGWAVLGFAVAVIVITVVSMVRLSTKEVLPPPPPPSQSVERVLEESNLGRQEESQKSLYRPRSTPWAAQARELALAFHDGNWMDRADDVLPGQVMDQMRATEWPVGTQPLISDYGKEGDSSGYSKISFREGWVAYVLVEVSQEGEVTITGVEFDRESN